MAESPDHEIQMELNVEQEQSQGDVSDVQVSIVTLIVLGGHINSSL